MRVYGGVSNMVSLLYYSNCEEAGKDGYYMAAKCSDWMRIMVAVNQSSIDGYPHPSVSSNGAFEWALNKIVRTNTMDFKLLLLHVEAWDIDDEFGDEGRTFSSPADFMKIKDKNTIRGLHLLEYFVKKCHKIGVSCEAWIKKGDAKENICSEIKRVCPDFLVVGSRGLGPFQRFFIRNVSEPCRKDADCPVIVIKRGADDKPDEDDPADD